MISFRLFVTVDLLNMYSRRPNAFDWRSLLSGQVFAEQVSVAAKAALTETGIQTMIQSRDVIGQAKGILMARRRFGGRQGLRGLRRLSLDRGQKLAKLAEEIARTGGIPGSNHSSPSTAMVPSRRRPAPIRAIQATWVGRNDLMGNVS